jgi:hypothetical protein
LNKNFEKMMKDQLVTILQHIIDKIILTPSGQIIIYDKPQIDNYLFMPPSESRIQSTIDAIKDAIYQNVYLAKTEAIGNDVQQKDYFKELRKANPSKNRLLKGYRVIKIEGNGNIVAESKIDRRRLRAGEYLSIKSFSQSMREKEYVGVYQPKEINDYTNSFYHVLGQTPDYQFPEALVRFYFNLKPAGSAILIHKLGNMLNESKVFFQFKCLKKPQDYTRADAGVLYVYKFDLNKFQIQLFDIFNEIAPFLNPEIPIFSYKIANGIGFAENPKDENESFGTLRCKLIAEGMYESYQQNIEDNKRVDFIVNYLTAQGYDLDKFYLNPNSRFQYPF